MNWLKTIKLAYQVQTNQGQGELVSSPNDGNLVSTFTYQTDTSNSEFRIIPLSLSMGILYPSATYISIQTSPPSDEIERQMISLVTEKLNRYPDVEFDIGENPFVTMLNKATRKNYTDDPDKVNMTEIEETEVLPLPRGVTVGYTQNTLKIIHIRPGDAKYTINSILRALEQIAQTFITNNLLEYYSIQSQGYGNKFIKSERGEKIFEKKQNTKDTDIGYLKFIINTVLKTYPNLFKKYSEYIDSHYPEVKPQNTTKIDLTQSDLIRKFFSQTYSDSELFNAMIKFDERKLSIMENMLVISEKNKIEDYKLENTISWIVKDANFDTLIEDINKDKWLYFNKIFLDKDIQNMLYKVGYGNRFEKLTYALQESIPRIIKTQNQYILTNKILPIYKKLDLDPNIIQFLDQMQVKENERKEFAKQEELLRAKEEEKLITKRSFVMNWEHAYMDLNKADDKFHEIPYKYWDGYSGDLNLGEMVLYGRDIGVPFDESSVRENAYEKAYEELSEEAYSNMSERPSTTYGEDESDVESDIEEYFEEFASELFSDNLAEFDELHGKDKNRNQQIIDTIKKNKLEEFIEWRKANIEKEEEESGEYEIEYWIDDAELNEKVSDIETAEAEKAAYEYGIMTARTIQAKSDFYTRGWETEADSIEFCVHSKFLPQATEVIKKFVDINLKSSKEDESKVIFNNNSKVKIYVIDSNQSIVQTPYDIKRLDITANNWYKVIKLASPPIGPTPPNMRYPDFAHIRDVKKNQSIYLYFITKRQELHTQKIGDEVSFHSNWEQWTGAADDNVIATGRIQCNNRTKKCKASLMPWRTGRRNPTVREHTINVCSKILDRKFNNPTIMVFD